MSALGFLLFLIMYISSVISRALYGDYWPLKFGSIGNAMLSCFQLLTLDDAFTFYDNIHVYDESISVFLFLYIVIATFVVCQMLIAIILSNLEEAQTQYNELVKDKFRKKKLLVSTIKDMTTDTVNLEATTTSSGTTTNINPSNMPTTNSPRTSRHTDPPNNASADKNVPPITLNNTNPDSGTSPITSHGNLSNDVHRLSDTKAISIAQKRVMDEYNRAFSQSTDREKQLTLQYFMGLASIENELNLYQNQMEVLDHLVHKLREQE
eukprot:Phypoly_transcript_04969.p1 GENE.Phypoly_transcript_04969~~Phypoly_transcript_04969.p1  ORF type:complete len:266 (+),score=30.25 Phypoly_transcript_04969:454-1251(+)